MKIFIVDENILSVSIQFHSEMKSFVMIRHHIQHEM